MYYSCEDGNDMLIDGYFETLEEAMTLANTNEKVEEVWVYETLPDNEVGDAIECVWKRSE